MTPPRRILQALCAVLGLAALALLVRLVGTAPPGVPAAPAPRPQGTGGRLGGLAAEPFAAAEGARERARRELVPAARPHAAETARRLVTGRVVRRSDGAPVGGAEVFVLGRDAAGEELVARTESDLGGAFEIDWPGAGPPALEVRAAGFAPARIPHVGALEGEVGRPAGEELTIPLGKGATLDVLLTSDRPIDFQTLRVVLLDHRGRPAEQESSRAVSLGAGRVRFSELSAGNWGVLASCEGCGATIEIGIPLAEGESREVVLSLVAGASIVGRVFIEGTGEPIAGATVELEPRLAGARDALRRLARISVSTDERGRFTLAGPMPGDSRLFVTAPWGARVRREVTARPGTSADSLLIALPGPASLAGRVVDAAGRPAAGAPVAIGPPARALALLASGGAPSRTAQGVLARTDDEGRFQFDGLPPGRPLLVCARTRGGEALASAGPLELEPGPWPEELTVVLAPCAAVRGAVRDPDGAPIAGARVRALQAVGGGDHRPLVGVESDAAGRFRIAGLPAGPVILAATAPGRRPARARVALLPPAEPAPVELVLAPDGLVRGVVTDPDGLGVPRARVRARAPALVPDDRGPARRATTADAFGRFELRGLAPGDWLLGADAPGYVTVGGEQPVRVPGAPPLELVLDHAPLAPPVRLVGTVVRAADGAPPASLAVDGTRGGTLLYEDGRLRLIGVRPGRRRFRFRAPGCVVYDTGALELVPGETRDLGTIVLASGTRLEVRVLGPEGEPVRRADVRLRPLPREQGGVGRGRSWRLPEHKPGWYALDGVPRALWRLTARRGGLSAASRRVRVRTDERQVFELRLGPGDAGGRRQGGDKQARRGKAERRAKTRGGGR